MRALLQRVSRAGVSVNGASARSIGPGLVILLGIAVGDTPEDLNYLVRKTVDLRIFNDDEGKMNRSLLDTGGEALIVSQFTLYGDARKGRRPSYTDAARPEEAIPLYEAFVEAVREQGIDVQTGEFGADMQVEIHNDGPVTLILESPTA
ncbi:TPA: D-tyrosyl-tRNA(Tyr) deacylase [Candidatus Latescibacteria bacterium]|nr:D-tyrosyl-tRNA(Tyr) deacylase [Candidatus Latescibacterota bacterium]